MKVLLASMLVCVLVGSASAVWMDDFESYPGSWGAIPAPWETSDIGESTFWIHPSAFYGYNNSKGAEGESGWGKSHQYRLTDGEAVTSVYAKVLSSSDNTHTDIQIGLNGVKGRSSGDPVYLGLTPRSGADDVSVILMSEDHEGGSYVTDNRQYWSSIQQNVWYDLRLDVSGGQATGYFKEVSGSTWTLVGTVTLYDDFDDTYVVMMGARAGRIDDIGYVPEPMTLALLAAGGLLIRRKR